MIYYYCFYIYAIATAIKVVKVSYIAKVETWYNEP